MRRHPNLKTALLAATLFLCFTPLYAAQPRHVYLTYSGAPESTIDINVMMDEKTKVVEVYYDTESRNGKPESYRQHITATYHRTLMELSDNRAMYVGELTGLQPATNYYFIAGDPDEGFTKERKLRTVGAGDAPIRFIDGGDIGVDSLAARLQKLAAKQDPDFVVIGGDIAYENGLLGDYPVYDRWLDNWEKNMVTPDGRMIPIVTAIGNHEVNDYESDQDELCAPWYIGLFGRQSKESYYSRTFGGRMVLFCLDSGHLRPQDGAQRDWLAAELEKYKDVPYKFAAYHVPLYPAHRAFDGVDSVLERTHWGPLFDQYKLTVGMEHHDHVFKRTKPLRGNQIAEGGTVYIGDGCFGQAARTVEAEPRWYNERQKSISHFWVIELTQNAGLRLRAISDKDNTIDEFSLP